MVTRPSWPRSSCPQIERGDKRILMIDGEPVPYCLARIPLAGETRGNLAAGGDGGHSRWPTGIAG